VTTTIYNQLPPALATLRRHREEIISESTRYMGRYVLRTSSAALLSRELRQGLVKRLGCCVSPENAPGDFVGRPGLTQKKRISA
jgi:hypothetical protein